MSLANRIIGISTSLLFGGLLAASLAGVHYNHTPSFPEGFYIETAEPVTRGVLVLTCPLDEPTRQLALARGYLSPGVCNGVEPVIKRIVAVAGDRLVIGDQGVSVNGSVVPYSRPLALDSVGRTLPRLRLDVTVPDGSVLLMSDFNSSSFDGRYFGLSARSSIISVLRLL